MKEEVILATVADFQRVFDSPEGKNVLSYLMKKSGFLHSTFVPGDPYMSAYHEGMRTIVLDIVEKLKIDIRQLEKELTKVKEREDYVSL